MREKHPLSSPEVEFLYGRLKQLQVRYPGFISDVRHGDLVVDVEFYLEDAAIDATHCVLDAGVTAVHRLAQPKVMSLQLPSLLDQEQSSLVIEVLDRFLWEKKNRRLRL